MYSEFTSNTVSTNEDMLELLKKNEHLITEDDQVGKTSFVNKSYFGYNCCKNCPNNPMNNKFASGVCNCVLPSMEAFFY